jgi:cardiolipin synthase
MSTVVTQRRGALITTATQLTILRIVFVPVFIILLTYDLKGYALATFVAAGLTDALDGIIARRFRQKSAIGAVLDPLADKLLMTASIILLSLPQMGFMNLIPRWLLIVMISRDVFILLVSLLIILTVGWRIFRPSVYGKASTVLQVVTILAVLYANWREVAMPDLKLLFALTGVLTVASGLHYLITSRRYLESE